MPPRDPVPADEAPPFWGTWRRIYLAVLAYLCGIIGLAYLFTRAYR